MKALGGRLLDLCDGGGDCLVEKGGEGGSVFGVFINGGILITGTRWPLPERCIAKMLTKQRLRKILAGSFRRW